MTGSVRYLVSVVSIGADTPSVAIMRAVSELGYVPVDLDATGIINRKPWESAQRHVERSDYLVVLVGRYKTGIDVPTAQVKHAFDTAVERDVPVLVVVPSKDGAKTDPREWREFIDKMVANPFGMSGTYTGNNDGFAGLIGRMIDTYVRPGFVSTTELPSKNVAEQLAELIRENQELKRRLGQDGGREEARQRRETVAHMLEENKILIPLWYRGATSWGEPMEMSLYDFFLRMGPELASEVSTAGAAEFIPVGVCGLDREDFRSRWPVPSNNLNLWFTDLMAIGVVEPSLRKRGKDEGQYWTLTIEGRELLADVRRSVLRGGGHRHVGYTSEFPIAQNMDADL